MKEILAESALQATIDKFQPKTEENEKAPSFWKPQ